MRWAAALGVACLAGILSGCALLKPTATPIASFTYEAGDPDADGCAILLPGRGGHPDDFARAGMPRALAESGFAGQVIGVDAHLGYYIRRTVIARVRADVVAPRADRQVWIVGVSLGGLGALLYEKTHPGEVAGIVLLAPYLGDDDVIAEIRAAGGLATWDPGELDPGDFQRELWRWIKQGGLDRVPVFIGWGEDDRFAAANAMLGTAVPHARTFVAPGGHTWPVWKTLFARVLAAGAFMPPSSPSAPDS